MNQATVEDILSRYEESTASLAGQLREFLLKELEDIREIPDNSIALVGYGYGSGYKDLICTMLLSKKGIKLGFYKGSELPDPHQLLTGSGKTHRYAVIKSAEDIRKPALKKLVDDAFKAWKKRKK